VHDTGVDESSGDLFLVMQLLRGAELHDLIGEADYVEAPPPVGWAAAIGAQIAAVLTEVHRLSVVHRDIKPRNLFVTPCGVVKVLDFGIAALLAGGDSAKLTRVGLTVGTPPYMSPEQVLANPVGPPSDLYALGCVLHEMLTGQPPFQGTGGRSTQYQQVHADPPAVRDVRRDVPAPVDDLIRALLYKQAEDRPSSEEVYTLLLPFTIDGHASGAAGVREDLDPTRPFRRPMAATPRAALGLVASLAPEAGQPPLSAEEADAATDRAADLAEAGQFTQAADVLGAAIGRADTDSPLGAELRLSLGHVMLLARDFQRAIEQFDTAGAWFAEHYGSDDETVMGCRYYATSCRAEAGEDSRALADFQMFLEDWSQTADDRDDRSIDVRRQIGGLLMNLGRYQEARSQLTHLHQDASRWQGPDSRQARRVAAMLERINQYQP
jgi:hypothetical protein